MLLTIGASQEYFSEMMKLMKAESKGRPSTHSTNQSDSGEDIAAVNFFLLSH